MNLGNDYVSEPQSSGVVKHKYLHRVTVRRKDHTHGSWLLVSQSKVILPTPPSGLPLPTEETPPRPTQGCSLEQQEPKRSSESRGHLLRTPAGVLGELPTPGCSSQHHCALQHPAGLSAPRPPLPLYPAPHGGARVGFLKQKSGHGGSRL